MGTGPFRRRQENRAQATAKLALARPLIVEADQRWHGMARFLEHSGMDHNAELVGRLARRAGGPAHGNAGPSPPPERRALTGSGERRANTNAVPDAPSQT
jgi:hypothetical protein